MQIFARAYGTTALTAPSTGSASMPVTVIAGPDQSRSPRPPVPRNGRPGSTSARSRNSSSLYDAPVPRLAPQTLDGDVAVLVVQRRERVQQRDQRVGAGTAELAAVLRARRASAASTITAAMPRRPMVSVGTPGRTLPMSAITITSQANSSGRVCG